MNLEQQVVSLELAKKLKELGVKQESHFQWEIYFYFGKGRLIWEDYHKGMPIYDTADVRQYYYYSAYTVAELGGMLPVRVDSDSFEGYLQSNKDRTISSKKVFWNVYYRTVDGIYIHKVTADTEANARAKMLIYLLENKLITL